MSRPLFLASLGNPGQKYMHTRHSAGHILLEALARAVGAPPMQRERRWANAGTTQMGNVVFWSSPERMNASGAPTASAWRLFLDRQPPSDRDAPHLVIFHDELELDVGRFSLKTGVGASARGHNGLKSLLNMPGMRDTEFSRVGIGIGPRPLDRDPETVARFVLGELYESDLDTIEGLAPAVWDKLMEFRASKDAEEDWRPNRGEAPLAEERQQWISELMRRDEEVEREDELVLMPGRKAAERKEFFKQLVQRGRRKK